MVRPHYPIYVNGHSPLIVIIVWHQLMGLEGTFTMKISVSLLTLLIVVLPSSFALGQRDAPVWSSYLPRIALFDERTKLDFEVTFNKDGGPAEQSNHLQMYVLGYLGKDEAKILELAGDKKLTAKSRKQDKLLLDVLVEKKLVTLLETKVANSAEASPVISNKSGRSVRSGSCFDYAFSFNNSDLFKLIGALKNFDHQSFNDSDHRYYNDKFKLMIFVPVNDCKYATKIPKEQRGFYDFAHFMDNKTIIQYFKPLPYRFQFKPLDEEGVVLLYVD